jgi:leader peptidase (prepilin peptidase)/N-methyltransferase
MNYGLDRFFVFMMGAIIGSFLNVCIYRMPRNKSIVFPASHCPHCEKDLYWYDNIPILSYMVLFGKCSFCRRKISSRYPIVEILTAALIVALFIKLGINVKFFVYSAFVCGLIVSTFIDMEFKEIPDSISLGGLILGLILAPIFPVLFDTAVRSASFVQSAIGALAGGGTIYAMGIFGRVLFKKDAMGGGDVKLMAMIGSILGWKLALLSFFIAPVFGAGVGIFMKMRSGDETIAYGPFLSMAAVISIFYGQVILRFLFYGM